MTSIEMIQKISLIKKRKLTLLIAMLCMTIVPIGKNYARADIIPSSTRFHSPCGLAFDKSSDRLYMCDQEDHRILWWNDASKIKGEKAADGVLGQGDFLSNEVSVLKCNATNLNTPMKIAVDAAGNLWVTDTNRMRVLKFNKPSKGFTEAAVLVLGQSNMTSLFITEMGSPTGVCVDSQGNVWVSDCMKCRVTRYDKPLLPAGERFDMVLGKTDFFDMNPGPVMHGPSGVAVDGDGNVWVAEDDTVQKYNKPTAAATEEPNIVIGTIPTIPTMDCNESSMSAPRGLCVDKEGNLWVADTFNNRVLKYNRPTAAAGEKADLVLGQKDFTSNVGACSESGLAGPSDVVVDDEGNVWVADAGNGRILKFNKPTKPTGERADLVLGWPDFVSNSFQHAH